MIQGIIVARLVAGSQATFFTSRGKFGLARYMGPIFPP